MAILVTANEVRTIMGLTDQNYPDGIVESYITAANRIVEDNLGNKNLSSETLKEIERWVSAHLIAVTQERQSKKEGAGGAYIEYTGNYTTGLNMTSYGQMAIAMDTTGTLSTLSKQKVKMFAIPTIHN